MVRIPEQATSQVSAAPGATPSITIAAPGASCSYVIDTIRSRLFNNGAGPYAVQVQVSDASGLRMQWVMSSYAPAGQVDSGDLDLSDLALVLQAGSAFTVTWSAVVPAGGAGDLFVAWHLAG